jgi:hypothetical protein
MPANPSTPGGTGKNSLDPGSRLPKPPSCRIGAVLELQQDAAVALTSELGGRLIDSETFPRLAGIFYELLPNAGLDAAALEDTLRRFVGRLLDEDLARELAWLVAGNLPRLRRGPVGDWRTGRSPEWIPLQVVSCRRAMSPSGRWGALLGFVVLAGTPASLVFHRWWPLGRRRFPLAVCRVYDPDKTAGELRRAYPSDLGFSRNWGPDSLRDDKYPYREPEQLVQLRLLALSDPVMRDEEGPGFPALAVSPSVDHWNRYKLKQRFRVDKGFVCPFGFPRALPCHRCMKGYASCPAATHAEDWYVAPCKHCGNDEAVFDPETAGSRCVDCYREARKREL